MGQYHRPDTLRIPRRYAKPDIQGAVKFVLLICVIMDCAYNENINANNHKKENTFESYWI